MNTTQSHLAIDEAVALAATLPAPNLGLCAVVVIPARDEAARIEGCLRALIDQQDLTPSSFEVIVILDGCRDRTPQIVA
ncbi:MAG TPA: glycosyltransferase, partial [Solirubrobacteraceae bacterium]